MSGLLWAKDLLAMEDNIDINNVYYSSCHILAGRHVSFFGQWNMSFQVYDSCSG